MVYIPSAATAGHSWHPNSAGEMHALAAAAAAAAADGDAKFMHHRFLSPC